MLRCRRKRPDSLDEISSERAPPQGITQLPAAGTKTLRGTPEKGSREGDLVAHTWEFSICQAEVGGVQEFPGHSGLHSKTPPRKKNKKRARFILAHFSSVFGHLPLLLVGAAHHGRKPVAEQTAHLWRSGGKRQRKRWGSRYPLEGHVPVT